MNEIRSPFLTTFEASSYLRASHKTLEKWRSTGDGPAFLRLGRKCFYTLECLDAWARSQRKRPAAARGRVVTPSDVGA